MLWLLLINIISVFSTDLSPISLSEVAVPKPITKVYKET